MKISQPSSNEFIESPYQSRYIQAVKGENPFDALKKNILVEVFKNLPEDKLLYRYAENKWTPKEILGHCIDTERILSYRVLCIARGEKLSLPPFEEDDYVLSANFNKRSLRSLLLEYKAVRKATLELIKNLPTKSLKNIGQANNLVCSTRSLIWVLAGHELHHLEILKERYL